MTDNLYETVITPTGRHAQILARIRAKSVESRRVTAQDSPATQYTYDASGKLTAITNPEDSK